MEMVGAYVSLSRKGWDGNVPLVSDRLHCRLNHHTKSVGPMVKTPPGLMFGNIRTSLDKRVCPGKWDGGQTLNTTLDVTVRVDARRLCLFLAGEFHSVFEPMTTRGRG